MPKGYVIVTETIHDPAGMEAYIAASGDSMTAHGGRLLVFEQDADVREGEWHGNSTIILEFDSVDIARAWYESDKYQAAIPIRQAAADCRLAIVSGFAFPEAAQDAPSTS
jgi:uncharacterized protein (DUF1330 family)